MLAQPHVDMHSRGGDYPVSESVQALTSFAITVQVMFLPNTGAAGVVAILATIGVLAFTHVRAITSRSLHSFPANVFCIVALLSTFWSAHPRITATYALELLVTTVIAMIVSGVSGRRGVLTGLAGGLSFYVIVSLVVGGSVAMGAHGGEAFSGLTGSKNFLAATAVFALIALVCAVGEAVTEGALRRAALLGAAIPVVAFVMLASRSSGAIVETVVIMAVVAFMAIVRLLRIEFRLIALLVLLSAIALLGIMYYLQRDAIDSFVLAAFQKDPTLTGRVYLWQRADEIIAQSPWLGRGYYAFWVQGDLDPEGLWQWAGISLRGGFNFHNTMREVLVAFGWIGFSIFAIATVYALCSRCIHCVIEAEFYDIFWLGVLVYNLLAMSWEAALPEPFNMASILLIAAFRPAGPGALGALGQWRAAHDTGADLYGHPA